MSILSNFFLEKLRSQKIDLPAVLFSDFDDTYLYKSTYNPKQELLRVEDEKKYLPSLALHSFLVNNKIPLIIVSGRDFFQITKLQSTFTSLFPHLSTIFDFDIFIGAVGTEIWIKNENNTFVECKNYISYIESTFSFKRDELFPVCVKLIDTMQLKFPEAQFRFQKMHEQKLKISFEFESSSHQTSELVKAVHQFFMSSIQEAHPLILSYQHQGNGMNTYNLDLVPCGKDRAVEYVIDSIFSSFGKVICFTAGDAGNDTSMLFNTKSIGIVVSNSKPELVNYVKTLQLMPIRKNFFSFQSKTCYISPNTLSPAQSIQQAIEDYFQK